MKPADVTITILAKQPRPGFSKTRLTPPFTPSQAAGLAEAMLRDTLDSARQVAVRRVVVLDGTPGPWLTPDFELLPQRGDGQAARIGNAFEDVGGPQILIGMDTPQVTPEQLEQACAALAAPGTDAVLGATPDGGWWIGGLKVPDARVFRDVPMSRADTAEHQKNSFRSFGLRWSELEPLADVDDHADALEVAAAIPGSRFARLLDRYGNNNRLATR